MLQRDTLPLSEMERKLAAELRGQAAVWTQDCPDPETWLDWIEAGEAHPSAAKLQEHRWSCGYCREQYFAMLQVWNMGQETAPAEEQDAATPQNAVGADAVAVMPPLVMSEAVTPKRETLRSSTLRGWQGAAVGGLTAAAALLLFHVMTVGALKDEVNQNKRLVRLSQTEEKTYQANAQSEKEQAQAAKKNWQDEKKRLDESNQLANAKAQEVPNLRAEIKKQESEIQKLRNAQPVVPAHTTEESETHLISQWVQNIDKGTCALPDMQKVLPSSQNMAGPDSTTLPAISLLPPTPQATYILGPDVTIRWKPLEQSLAEKKTFRYEVSIYDRTGERFVVQKSEIKDGASQWTGAVRVPPGHVCRLEVSAFLAGQQKAVARSIGAFALIDPAVAKRLRQRKQAGTPPLVMGLLYAQAGVLDMAEKEFDAVPLHSTLRPNAEKLRKYVQDHRLADPSE